MCEKNMNKGEKASPPTENGLSFTCLFSSLQLLHSWLNECMHVAHTEKIEIKGSKR